MPSRPKTPFIPGKGYYVRWLDASFCWSDPGENPEEYCEYLGWYLKESEFCYIFSSEKGDEESRADATRFHMTIPKGMVVEWEEVRG